MLIYILFSFQSAIGLNESHQNEIVNYLRFARYNRGQTLKSIDSCFSDIKDSRLESIKILLYHKNNAALHKRVSSIILPLMEEVFFVPIKF